MICFFIFSFSCTQEIDPCSDPKETKVKDQCLHNEILTIPSTNFKQIISKAKEIQDPMIRGAAVSAWVRDHNHEITQKQGKALCELLDGRDKFYCIRRLSSPHLKR